MVVQPHIKLESVSEFCLLSGNPDRIRIMAQKLKEPEELSTHRGLVSYRGLTPNREVPVTLLTTGMGAPSTAIVVEETYRAGGKIMIRIGSCGSLQVGPQYGIGSIYVPASAIREEGTSKKLVPLEYPATATPRVFQALCQASALHGISPITSPVWTSDIYYFQDPEYFKKYVALGAACVEMESALLFSYPAIKHDLQVGSILTSDGNLNQIGSIYQGDVDKNLSDFNTSVSKTIDIAISAIEQLAS